MSARARTYAIVAVAALAGAGLVVATVAFTRTSTGGGGTPHSQTTAERRRAPTLVLDLGVRTDPEAVALRRANRLYARGGRAAARKIFARYDSLEARVGDALARWPVGTVTTLQRLAAAHPRSGLVLLHLGLAQLAAGSASAARVAWRRALAGDPDTEYAIQAEQLLHPGLAPGRPPFVPSFATPGAVNRLPAPQQLDALRKAAARSGSVRTRLLYGAALQRLGRSVSAEREFALAAHAEPNDPEAQVAAAVGRFAKADPAGAFSRLGPLSARFPRSQSARFHLGELLLWIRQVDEARLDETRMRRPCCSAARRTSGRRKSRRRSPSRRSTLVSIGS